MPPSPAHLPNSSARLPRVVGEQEGLSRPSLARISSHRRERRLSAAQPHVQLCLTAAAARPSTNGERSRGSRGTHVFVCHFRDERKTVVRRPVEKAPAFRRAEPPGGAKARATRRREGRGSRNGSSLNEQTSEGAGRGGIRRRGGGHSAGRQALKEREREIACHWVPKGIAELPGERWINKTVDRMHAEHHRRRRSG